MARLESLYKSSAIKTQCSALQGEARDTEAHEEDPQMVRTVPFPPRLPFDWLLLVAGGAAPGAERGEERERESGPSPIAVSSYLVCHLFNMLAIHLLRVNA